MTSREINPAIIYLEKTVLGSFCDGCNSLTSGGTCAKDTVKPNSKKATDQIRYAQRGDCGWASKNGKQGRMTRNGFVPNSD